MGRRMIAVPFYSNKQDNTHCHQAVLKIILKYYFPERDYSWEELDKMTGKKEGKYTWPACGLITMANLGFKIKVVGIFDYNRFIGDPINYLTEEYGEEVARVQIENSNIDYEVENIKILKNLIEKENLIKKEIRIPDISELINLISDDYLIQCNINSKRLVGLNGYAGHSVLVYGVENDCFILHDPGLPPNPSFRIKFDKFNAAWAYPDNRARSLDAFKHIN